jgi:PKD repeat protein
MNFTNNSSGANSYSWNFDDGNSSTSASPSNTYSTPGKYSVMLTATSSAGCSDDLTKVVEVYSLPTASFTATNECLGDDMSTTNLSSGASSYAWTFGDGNSSTATAPAHTYNSSGNYTVTLTATSSNSCTDQASTTVSIYSLPVASFSANTVCEGTATSFTNGTSGTNSYDWNFGDGTSSTLSSPNKTYGAYGNYNVTLTATSSEGCTDDSTVVVTVNEQPTAAFAATTECSGDSTTFTNNSGGTIATYAWDFDNGSTSTDMSPKVAYAAGGTYEVELTVSTSQGCTDAVSNKVTVYSTPTAAYTVSDVCLENAAVFKDSASSGNGSIIIDREFIFGDGNNDFGRNVTHFYNKPDTYSTMMVVTTVNGCSDTSTQSVVVNPLPSLNITANDTCEFDEIQFVNNSKILSGSISSYQWNFNDGNITTIKSPSHAFDTMGQYIVLIEAVSDQGCKSHDSLLINIAPKPRIAFSAENECENDSVSFNNSTTIAKGRVDYNWIFGDGNSSSNKSLAHLYDSASVYNIQFIATSNKGCTSDTSFTLEIYEKAVAVLGIEPTCLGDSTFLPDTTSKSIKSTWKLALSALDTTINYLPNGFLINNIGSYPIALKVETPNGCTDSIADTLVVLPSPKLDDFIYNRNPNQSIEFSALTNTDSVSYLWNFDDGQTDTGSTVLHQFSTAEQFEVSCTISNGSGCTDVITKTVDVYPTGINRISDQIDFMAYPNPFTNWVNIDYSLTSNAYVKIEIFNMQGKLITTVADGFQTTGNYKFSIDENKLKMATSGAFVKMVIDNEVIMVNLLKLK